MFDNISGKIKGMAGATFVIGLISTIIWVITSIIAAVENETDMSNIFWSAALSASGTVVLSYFIYGFGELIEKITAIEKNTRKYKEDDDTEDLPKYEISVKDKAQNKKASNTKIPYWCKECGHEGPYIGKCPECGCTSIRYE